MRRRQTVSGASSRLSGGQAFTLIELLVVISIISLLIAILLPALSAARTAAHVVHSQSSARQLAFAVHIYAEDHQGSLPQGRFLTSAQVTAGTATTTPLGVSWANKLLAGKYVTTAKMFWSPGRDTSNINFAGLETNPLHTDLLYSGYGVNTSGAMPLEAIPASHQYTPLRLDDGANPQPSWHLLMFEAWRTDYYPGSPNKDGWYSGSVGTGRMAFTYNGTLVRSYLDGHAVAQDGSELGWVHTGFRQGSWSSNGRPRPWYHRNYPNEW